MDEMAPGHISVILHALPASRAPYAPNPHHAFLPFPRARYASLWGEESHSSGMHSDLMSPPIV